jgi:hypothetical protein
MTESTAHRRQTIIVFAGVILWQIYLAIMAYRTGGALENLLHGIGAQVGPGVALFLVTCRWWLVVPVIFTVLAIVAIRRLDSTPTFALVVVAASIAVSLLLNIWWREAWFGPILRLIHQVG